MSLRALVQPNRPSTCLSSRPHRLILRSMFFTNALCTYNNIVSSRYTRYFIIVENKPFGLNSLLIAQHTRAHDASLRFITSPHPPHTRIYRPYKTTSPPPPPSRWYFPRKPSRPPNTDRLLSRTTRRRGHPPQSLIISSRDPAKCRRYAPPPIPFNRYGV